MKNRIKIIIFAILFMAIIVGADRALKMNSINSGKLNESGDIVSEELSKVIEVTYESFSGEVLQSDKVVLIDFYATWCNPCKILSPTVEEIANERSDIKVVKIDVDKEPELANEYGIMSLPTLLVIESGEVKNKSIGVVSKEAIESML